LRVARLEKIHILALQRLALAAQLLQLLTHQARLKSRERIDGDQSQELVGLADEDDVLVELRRLPGKGPGQDTADRIGSRKNQGMVHLSLDRGRLAIERKAVPRPQKRAQFHARADSHDPIPAQYSEVVDLLLAEHPVNLLKWTVKLDRLPVVHDGFEGGPIHSETARCSIRKVLPVLSNRLPGYNREVHPLHIGYLEPSPAIVDGDIRVNFGLEP
jgi:hypothetical protein